MKWWTGVSMGVLASLVLGACGSETKVEANEPTGLEVAATTWEPLACDSTGKVVHVQLFGDSTQYGLDGWTLQTASVTPANALQQEMDGLFGAGAVVVENRAVPGTTSTELVNGTDGLNRAWPGSVTGDIVLVNHGINDSKAGLSLDDYQKNLRILGAAPGAVVILETPNPIHDHVYETDSYAAAMRSTAATSGLGVADTNAYVKTFDPWAPLVSDGIHPDRYLYVLIAQDVLAPVITPLVSSLRCR